MQPKMFANLFEAIEKFVEQNCETPEWEQEDMFAHENLVLQMAKAAELIFHAAAESSRFTKEQEAG